MGKRKAPTGPAGGDRAKRRRGGALPSAPAEPAEVIDLCTPTSSAAAASDADKEREEGGAEEDSAAVERPFRGAGAAVVQPPPPPPSPPARWQPASDAAAERPAPHAVAEDAADVQQHVPLPPLPPLAEEEEAVSEAEEPVLITAVHPGDRLQTRARAAKRLAQASLTFPLVAGRAPVWPLVAGCHAELEGQEAAFNEAGEAVDCEGRWTRVRIKRILVDADGTKWADVVNLHMSESVEAEGDSTHDEDLQWTSDELLLRERVLFSRLRPRPPLELQPSAAVHLRLEQDMDVERWENGFWWSACVVSACLSVVTIRFRSPFSQTVHIRLGGPPGGVQGWMLLRPASVFHPPASAADSGAWAPVQSATRDLEKRIMEYERRGDATYVPKSGPAVRKGKSAALRRSRAAAAPLSYTAEMQALLRDVPFSTTFHAPPAGARRRTLEATLHLEGLVEGALHTALFGCDQRIGPEEIVCGVDVVTSGSPPFLRTAALPRAALEGCFPFLRKALRGVAEGKLPLIQPQRVSAGPVDMVKFLAHPKNGERLARAMERSEPKYDAQIIAEHSEKCCSSAEAAGGKPPLLCAGLKMEARKAMHLHVRPDGKGAYIGSGFDRTDTGGSPPNFNEEWKTILPSWSGGKAPNTKTEKHILSLLFPDEEAGVIAAAEAAWAELQALEPTEAKAMRQAAGGNSIGNTGWNKYSLNLDYRSAVHYDSQNTEDSWSALIVFESGSPYFGGEYLLPQCRLQLDARPGCLLLHKSQLPGVGLHANNCIRANGEESHRVSLVFYNTR